MSKIYKSTYNILTLNGEYAPCKTKKNETNWGRAVPSSGKTKLG
jgi:hypothetical protein